MNSEKIPLMDLKKQYQQIQPEIDAKLKQIFTECSFIGGVEKDSFEIEYAKLMGAKHCIGVANGTDALFLIMKAMQVGKGDKVITVANSFIASSETISATGATPIFVDVDEKNFLIDLNKLENLLKMKAVSNNIKAIVLVHLYGHIVDMPRLLEITDKYNVKVIEDCAQSHLASIGGKKSGTWGVAGSFSFYPGKNLGAAGDAGAIITDDDELAQKIRMLANHGRIDKYNHVIEGFNSRLDSIQAAVLRIKLKYIEAWTEKRKEKALIYNELLAQVPEVIRPNLPDRERHVFHLYTLRVKNRDEVVKQMKAEGIEVGVHYPIMLPALKAYEYLKCTPNDFPVANVLQNEIMSLPLYPEITLEQQKRIVEVLTKIVKR
ncbi:MAG: DegT/DnrJ/EryC1/StrS family aminotransferase [Bdellovibrionota bacterium]